jgi:hypothetical protein
MEAGKSSRSRRQLVPSREMGIRVVYMEISEDGDVLDRILYLPLVSFDYYDGDDFRWEGYWKDNKIVATFQRKNGFARFSEHFPATHTAAAEREINRIVRRFR